VTGNQGVRPPVVVGGGFAGLSAAAILAERGRAPVVLEARGRLGGRATAFRDRDTGERVDNGQHVLFGCYVETLAFLRRIGAAANVRVQATMEIPFIDEHGTRSSLRCPRLPAPLHLLAGVLRWDAIPVADRLSALRLAPALLRARRRSETTAADVQGTVADWLRAHGQTARLIEALWEPLAVAALNQSIDTAAAAPFVTVLARMFGPDPGAAALVLPTRPLDKMYAEPARSFIERSGGTVRTDALARIVTDASGVCAVEVRGERIPTRQVIAAVPWHSMHTLFTDVSAALAPLLAAGTATASMPIVTVNLWYDRVVMNEPFVGLIGRTIHWIFDKRQVFGDDASHLSLVVSAAGALDAVAREDLVVLADREVRAALPGARAATLVRGTVVREKRATFSLAPGQPRRPGTNTAVPGLFLAGDWIDTSLPSTIEGAVVSGHAAARALLEQ
jgi:squalene-associated FAD-dependent desaturase